jgi:hypothetical protein
VLLLGIGVVGLLAVVALAVALGRRAGLLPSDVRRIRASVAGMRSTATYAVVVAVGVAVTMLVVYLIGRLGGRPAVLAREHDIHGWVADHRIDAVSDVFNVVTGIGNTWLDVWVAVALGVAITAWQRRLRPLLLLVLVVPAEFYLQLWVKHVIHTPKPDPATVVGPVGSYFSGGTARVLLVTGLAAIFLAPAVGARVRAWLPAVVLTLTYVEVFTRWYLGRHWVADLIGGVVLGTGLLAAVLLAERRMPSEGIAGMREKRAVITQSN